MPRILLVDDDIAEISAVKRVLSKAGHVPALATNAADAVIALEQTPAPELLVLSSTCDGGACLELARRLEADGAARALPIVFLGEAPGAPARARALPRPVDPGQLLDEVRDLLAAAAAGPAPRSAAAPARVAAPAPRPGSAPRPPPAGARPGAPAPSAPPPAARPHPAAANGAAAKPGLGAPRPPAASRPAAAPAPKPAAAPAAAPAADARKAAAEALRARAEELRKGAPKRPAPAALDLDVPAPPPAPAPSPAAAQEDPDDALFASLTAPEPPAAAAPAAGLALEDDGLEALLRRAEEAERAKLAERAGAEEAERAREREAERARAEREEAARRAREAKARAEEETRRAEEEAARAREAARAAADEEARRARDAEEKAAAEAEARRRAEAELSALREQLEAERRRAEEELRTVKERAAAEEQAADELRRFEEAEARRQKEAAEREREEEEERLREAIASARAEMDALRKRGEEEARRRAEAEAELRRVANAAERARAVPPPAAPPSAFGGPAFARLDAPPEPDPYLDAPEPDPEVDPAEEAARRRVAALRAGRAPPPPPAAAPRQAAPARAGRPPEPPRDAWMTPPAPPPEPEPAPEAPPLAPPPPELRQGTLAELPAPRLLAAAARAGLAGRLDFHGETARSIWFEDGRVVGASSADPADRVEETALRLGLVTRDQHRQIAAAAAALPTRRAALLLLERGFLKPTELTGLVRRRTEDVVFGVFAEEAARFRWVPQEVPPEERTALERAPLALAVEGVRRRWRAPRVDALLGGPGTLVAPAPGAPPLAELGLSPEERRVVSLADGLRTLDEIVGASTLDGLTTRQLLGALVLVGALAVRLLQAGRPQAAAASAIDLARVKDKLDQVRRADYFTVLGVGRLCTPHEVREAADRLLAEFDPRRHEGVKDEGLPARLDEIAQVVRDARDVLADDHLRDEYLRGLD